MSQELERGIRYEAARHFRNVTDVRHVLSWMRRNKQLEFSSRIVEFDNAIAMMNSLLQKDINYDKHCNLVLLKDTIGEAGLPQLDELMDRYRNINKLDDPIPGQIDAAFSTIAQKIKTKEWQFPGSTGNPGGVASELLIKGYGLLLESYYDMPEFAEMFVSAFEEVLLTKFPLHNEL